MSSHSLETAAMKQVINQPAETAVDVLCDVCGRSTRMQGSALQFGTLRADWGSGTQHDGEQ